MYKKVLTAIGMLTLCLLPTQTATAASSDAEIRGKCGNPDIHAWYDQDQYGKYLKIYFETPPGCSKGRESGLYGEVTCTAGPRQGDRLYKEIKNGNAPVKTLVRALPPKSQCKSFYAYADVVYDGFATTPFRDTWRWNWGNYPA